MAQDWTVTSQRQTDQLNAAGTAFETVWVVTYQVTSGPATGASGKVTVPESRYTADYVSELVQDQVDRVNGIAAL